MSTVRKILLQFKYSQFLFGSIGFTVYIVEITLFCLFVFSSFFSSSVLASEEGEASSLLMDSTN